MFAANDSKTEHIQCMRTTTTTFCATDVVSMTWRAVACGEKMPAGCAGGVWARLMYFASVRCQRGVPVAARVIVARPKMEVDCWRRERKKSPPFSGLYKRKMPFTSLLRRCAAHFRTVKNVR